jgi:hypothetical protein
LCNFNFASAKIFVEKKSHRLLLREAVQRAEASDQIRRANADGGSIADVKLRAARRLPHAILLRSSIKPLSSPALRD